MDRSTYFKDKVRIVMPLTVKKFGMTSITVIMVTMVT